MKLNAKLAKILFLVAIIFTALLIKNNVSLAAEPATLNVNLNVNDEKYDVSEVEYILAIEMKDSENNPIEGTFNCTGCKEETITFREGKASCTVIGSPVNVAIEGLTAGWNYTIKSGKNPLTDHYITDKDEYTGVLNEGNTNVQINCEVFTQDIDITACISGFPEGLEFPLCIRMYSSEKLYLKEKLKYEGAKNGELNFNEMGTVYLKNGDKITIKDVPVGKEVNNISNATQRLIHFGEMDGATPGYYDINGNQIGQSGGIFNSMVFTLHFEPTYPMIKKMYGPYGGEKDKEFSVKIKAEFNSRTDYFDNAPISGNYPYKVYNILNFDYNYINNNTPIGEGIAEFNENGEAILKIKANEIIVIGDRIVYCGLNGEELTSQDITDGAIAFGRIYKDHCFPYTTKFTVEELNSEGYENTAYEYGNLYTIVNNRLFNGNLTLTKKVEGEEADLDKEFKFKIKLYPDDEVLNEMQFYQQYVFYDDGTERKALGLDENCEAEVTLKNGEKITISSGLGGLPVGIKYKITEEDYTEDGYITTAENAEGTIKEGENIVDFTNTKKVEEPEEEEEVIEEEPVEEEEIEEIEEAPQTGDIIIKVCTTLVISLILINGLATYISRRNK